MGIHHKDGYSAHIEGFLVVGNERFRVAKSNGCTFALADTCELPPNTEVELLVVVDGNASSRIVMLPDGVLHGQSVVKYKVCVPF
jgi:hypothetical protein